MKGVTKLLLRHLQLRTSYVFRGSQLVSLLTYSSVKKEKSSVVLFFFSKVKKKEKTVEDFPEDTHRSVDKKG